MVKVYFIGNIFYAVDQNDSNRIYEEHRSRVIVKQSFEGSSDFNLFFSERAQPYATEVPYTHFVKQENGIEVPFTDGEDLINWFAVNMGGSGFNNGGGNGETGVTFNEDLTLNDSLKLDDYYVVRGSVNTTTTYELDVTGAELRILESYIIVDVQVGGSFTMGNTFPQNVRDAVGTITDTGEHTIALNWNGKSFAFTSVSSSGPIVTPNPPVITSAVVENNARDVLEINLDAISNVTDNTDLSLSFTVGSTKTITSTVIGSGSQTISFILSADIEENDVFDLVVGASNNIVNATPPNTNVDPVIVAVTNNVTSATQERGLIETTSGSSTYIQDTMRAVVDELQFFKATSDRIEFVELNDPNTPVSRVFDVGSSYSAVLEPQDGIFNPSPIFGGVGNGQCCLGYENFNRMAVRSDQGRIIRGGNIVRNDGLKSYRFDYVSNNGVNATIEVYEGDVNEANYVLLDTYLFPATDTFTIGHVNRSSGTYCDNRVKKFTMDGIVFNLTTPLDPNTPDVYSTP